jgi:integrase
VSESQAQAKGVEVDETLNLIDRGRLTVPDGVSLEDFVAAGGKVPTIAVRPEIITSRQLFDGYLKTHANSTVEESSLGTSRGHLNQIVETIGERFRVQTLTLQDLQLHVDRRRKKGIAPVTLKKEIATFRGCWNWATHGGLLKGPFPNKGLRIPKEEEKEPFRTFAEIEAVITTEHLDEDRLEALWKSLYLTCAELEEFLAYVRQNGTLPWLYPMVTFAAFTGARRSEMLRSLLADVDLEAGIVTIREKKRVRGKRSTRTAPITPKLAEVLRGWLAVRPTSTHLFCQAAQVTRSKKKREAPTAVTPDEAHDHFKRTIADSKWQVMRGYHVLRHSFSSNMIAAGVDQRIIDEIMGHSTEEQRRRYRHLAPKLTSDAVKGVFG